MGAVVLAAPSLEAAATQAGASAMSAVVLERSLEADGTQAGASAVVLAPLPRLRFLGSLGGGGVGSLIFGSCG